MLKRKHLISCFIILSLGFTLFAGLVVAQSIPLPSPEPVTQSVPLPPPPEPDTQTGYVSVPAAAFEPDGVGATFEIINFGEKVVNLGGFLQILVAPVQIPNGVTVTKVTFYYFQDDNDEIMRFYLVRDPGFGSMAYAESSENGTYVAAYDDIINDAIIDNSQKCYYLQINLPPVDTPFDQGFNYAVIEYEYSTVRYQDASNLININELPGERINLFTQGSTTVLVTETTNVWHGFFRNSWSTKTEEQRTEFLATAEWHFFVDAQEVPVTHIFRYDEEEDRMWSLYYRVFPPGYFASDRNHKLVGEWIVMNDGSWNPFTREGTLRVLRPLMPNLP